MKKLNISNICQNYENNILRANQCLTRSNESNNIVTT